VGRHPPKRAASKWSCFDDEDEAAPDQLSNVGGTGAATNRWITSTDEVTHSPKPLRTSFDHAQSTVAA